MSAGLGLSRTPLLKRALPAITGLRRDCKQTCRQEHLPGQVPRGLARKPEGFELVLKAFARSEQALTMSGSISKGVHHFTCLMHGLKP